MSLAGFWQRNFTEGTSGAKVDELLNVSSLQRLAREKTMEMQVSVLSLSFRHNLPQDSQSLFQESVIVFNLRVTATIHAGNRLELMISIPIAIKVFGRYMFFSRALLGLKGQL